MVAKKKSKKPAAKKTTHAKTAKAAPAKVEKTVMPLSKVQPADNPRTKGDIMTLLAETTGISRRDVRSVFESLVDMTSKDLGKKGCGLFTIPGLMKIRRINKPATKARKGINPFTKEETTFKARPARNVVKVRPLKALKDMV